MEDFPMLAGMLANRAEAGLDQWWPLDSGSHLRGYLAGLPEEAFCLSCDDDPDVGWLYVLWQDEDGRARLAFLDEDGSYWDYDAENVWHPI